MQTNYFPEFEHKMRAAGLDDAVICAFHHGYSALLDGSTGIISETSLQPVPHLPHANKLTPADYNPALLAQSVMVKLNGGLGTSMGLDGPKSLLEIKNGLSFLDIVARQVSHIRTTSGVPLRILLMNSFSTSRQTLEWLRRNPELGTPQNIELMQNTIPKVDAKTLRPAVWPTHPELEWCPPGHGDLYASLLGSGWLNRLLEEGVRFLFVSNADNLGATLDGALLEHFADSEKPFLMEVCERTAADRKGGHLAMRNGRMLLRESAQCSADDGEAFQDITRHRYFNTNNLWLRLDRLRDLLERNGGSIPLPVIQNRKPVDPRDADSPTVIQLESAMGAAIECFEGAGAIVVPRSRFAPVKTTADLMAVRSDAYVLASDAGVVLDPVREGTPPTIDLDPEYYKLVDRLEGYFPEGVPSLKHCASLSVRGPVHFAAGTVIRGTVNILNPSTSPSGLPAAVYADTTVTL